MRLNLDYDIPMKTLTLPCIALILFTSTHISVAQSPPPPVAPILTPAQLSAVVIITGNAGDGTGFFCQVKGRTFVVTNQHVLAGNLKATFKTLSGKQVFMGKVYATTSADVALLEPDHIPKDVTPLVLLERPETEALKDDVIIIPGNSKGGGVITQTPGKLIALGPGKVEVDNPVYPGNSGSPMIHVKSGKVIGLLTEAELISLNAFEVASFLNKESSIKSEIRYYGHRIDTVKKWKKVKWAYFQESNRLIDQSRLELTSLGAYFTGSSTSWKKFKNLHEAHIKAETILDSKKYSEANKIQALRRLIRDFQSYSRIAVKRSDNRELTYVHLRGVETLQSIAKNLLAGSQIVERDVKLLEALIQRGN